MTTILIDADYIDQLAFEVTVNFERMLERRINKLDISRWVDYLALDGGLRPGNAESIQVVMLYSNGKENLKNCLPSNLDSQLNATAITTALGEFCFSSHKVEQEFVSMGEMYGQSVKVLLNDDACHTLLLIADLESYGNKIKNALQQSPNSRKAMLFTISDAGNYRCAQERLTYSIMAAMNIKGEEIK